MTPEKIIFYESATFDEVINFRLSQPIVSCPHPLRFFSYAGLLRKDTKHVKLKPQNIGDY